MDLNQPPERKARIVVVSKTKMKEKYKQKRVKRSRKKKEAIDKKNKMLEKKTIFKKKSPFEEIYEYLTNTITEDREAEMNRKRRKRRGARNPNEQRLLELEAGIDKYQDLFLESKDLIEIRKNYEDMNMGDFVLVFPNPDDIAKNKSINLKEALTLYDTSLNVVTEDPSSKHEAENMRDAYIKAFIELDEFDEVAEKKREQEKKEELRKFQEREKQKKKESQMREMELKQKIKQVKRERMTIVQNRNSPDKERPTVIINPAVEGNKKNKADEKTPLKKGSEREGELFNSDFKNTPETQKMNTSPIVENLVKPDVKEHVNIKRKFGRGGFLSKETYKDSEEFDWICNNVKPRDFLTLLRNTVMSKLSRSHNIHTRPILSSDQKKIFVVLKAHEEVLVKEAAKNNLNKQLELGFCDLFSLEPVDKLNRPLRLKSFLRESIFMRKSLEEEDFNEEEEKQNMLNFDGRAKLEYQKIRKLDDAHLQSKLCKTLKKLDVWLKKVSHELELSLPGQYEEIIDDIDINRSEWEAFYLYMNFIISYLYRVERLKTFPEGKTSMAFCYRLVFQKAIGESNKIWYKYNKTFCGTCLGTENYKKQLLKNIWDRSKITPSAPYMDFFEGRKGDKLWRRYEVNEKGRRSLLSNVDRLKLVHSCVLSSVNVMNLMTKAYILGYFPLHSYFQLLGDNQEKYFKPLYDEELLLPYKESPGESLVKKFFLGLSEFADKSDFDTDGSSVNEDTSFNLWHPLTISIDSLRDYFGEKIAIYFDFLSNYSYNMWWMAFLSIIAQIIIDHIPQKYDYIADITRVIFCFLIIIWSTVFMEVWKREEARFSQTYGQQGFEEDEAERPAFKGKFIRSIIKDTLNEEYYSPFKRRLKIGLSYFVSILILSCCIACVIGIFFLRSYLVNHPNYSDNSFVSKTCPSLLNTFQIIIFNTIYQLVALKMNDFENHQISTTYEKSLIFKIFCFRFFNTFNSMIFIAFFGELFPALNLCLTKPSQDLGCGLKEDPVNDCFEVLSTQMRSNFIVAFIMNIPELVVPFLKLIVGRKLRNEDPNPVIHALTDIDNHIESQVNLEPYQTNIEVDGTLADYMEIIVQFGFLCFFGVAFPCSYLLAFASNIAEIQVDKTKLIRFTRRPIPAGAANIGTWYTILDIISFLAIFINAGLICYTTNIFKGKDRVMIFVILMLVFLLLKYVIRMFIPDVPQSVIITCQRHENIKERTITGYKSRGVKQLKPSKTNLKITGLQVKMPEGMAINFGKLNNDGDKYGGGNIFETPQRGGAGTGAGAQASPNLNMNPRREPDVIPFSPNEEGKIPEVKEIFLDNRI